MQCWADLIQLGQRPRERCIRVLDRSCFGLDHTLKNMLSTLIGLWLTGITITASTHILLSKSRYIDGEKTAGHIRGLLTERANRAFSRR